MSNIETCPVCGVNIENKSRVIFSCGPSGTRERLKARVCSFVKDADKKAACINQGNFTLKPEDYYGSNDVKPMSDAKVQAILKELNLKDYS